MVHGSTVARQFESVADTYEAGNEPRTASLVLVNPSMRRAPRSESRLRVLVGVQDDGLNGIETYAEQVAVAACESGHEATLLATTDKVASAIRARTAHTGLEVISLGLAAPSKSRVFAQRLLPQLHTQRVGEAMLKTVAELGRSFDVVHLNRPALAPYLEGQKQIFVAGWYYPHAPAERLRETWTHTQGKLPRRLVLAAKSIAYYAGDAYGYRASTAVIACTETLAAQLREQGLRAVACPPPVQASKAVADDDVEPGDVADLRLLVCCGDLSHPRKNVAHALRATEHLASSHRSITLRVIGGNADALGDEVARLPASIKVEFLGTKSPAEVRDEMRKAHAFLLPSLYEEWGYVAVESILSGTPVVTYPVYPFADMLAGGLGVVAKEISPESFAEAIRRSLNNMRGTALAEAGERRFGASAVGTRLSNIWSSSAAPSLDDSLVAAPAFA